MKEEFKSTADLSNLVGSIIYYELQWWTYGSLHVERFLCEKKVWQRITDLHAYCRDRLGEELEYILTKCEHVDTNSSMEWYSELLEKENDGYSVTR